ncbi:MAG: cupin domain-containing protein [Terriglobia bacterium]
MLTPEQLIKHLDLKPLPVEGGYFRQTCRAEEMVPAEALPARYRSAKAFSTAIYYLLTSDPDSFSALHTLPTAEVYHFYLGDPVEMLLLHPDHRSERVVLGQDVLNGQYVQFIVPRGVWQGSRLIPGGRYALLGTTMAPGFDAQDYAGGDRDVLIRGYPEHGELIGALTRSGSALRLEDSP